MVFGQKLEIKRYHTKNLALDSVRGRIGGFAGKGWRGGSTNVVSSTFSTLVTWYI